MCNFDLDLVLCELNTEQGYASPFFHKPFCMTPVKAHHALCIIAMQVADVVGKRL